MHRASKDDRQKSVVDIETIYCLLCKGGDAEEYLLLCDGCNGAYHTFCLTPPLHIIPVGEWLCPTCLAKVKTIGSSRNDLNLYSISRLNCRNATLCRRKCLDLNRTRRCTRCNRLVRWPTDSKRSTLIGRRT